MQETISIQDIDESPEPNTARGRNASGPTQIPLRGWKDIAWRIAEKFTRDRVMLVAGGVTFYLLLALFPALAAFVSLFGLFADPGVIAQHAQALDAVLPDDAVALITDQLVALASQTGSALTLGFFISLAIAFWSANNGTKAIFEALNIAYQEDEKRSFIWLNLVAFSYTIGAMLIAGLMIFSVGVIPALLAFLNLGALGEALVRYARWPVLLVFIAVAIAVLYRYGPSRNPPRWRWVTWGSGLATLVWLVTAIAFTRYLENFADYNATYGSLGAAVGFMFWVWVSAVILIVGAELNAEMEHQTKKDTTIPPDLPMGERGAHVADSLGKTSG